MNKVHNLSVHVVAAALLVGIAAGCSSVNGPNRTIAPAPPLTTAQLQTRQQLIEQMVAKNPKFHVPPGILAGAAPLPPYLQHKSSANAKAAGAAKTP